MDKTVVRAAKKSLDEPVATIAKVTLTDNSIAWNVLLKVEGQTIVFAAYNARHAQQLALAMNGCAWIERAA